MQTFLPYASFRQSARVLDRQRLGKQRVEGLQILYCLLGVSCHRWQQHPAVRMWKGYEAALARYVVTVCQEWQQRGYADTVQRKVCQLQRQHALRAASQPPWLGQENFHRAHQSNLLRKDVTYYRQHFPRIRSTYPYIWPVNDDVHIEVAPTTHQVRQHRSR